MDNTVDLEDYTIPCGLSLFPAAVAAILYVLVLFVLGCEFPFPSPVTQEWHVHVGVNPHQLVHQQLVLAEDDKII